MCPIHLITPFVFSEAIEGYLFDLGSKSPHLLHLKVNLGKIFEQTTQD
jgi:hypothetical protein